VPSDAPTKRIPGLAFVYGVNSVSTTGGLIGVLRIRSKYRFRQRNVMPTVPFQPVPRPLHSESLEYTAPTYVKGQDKPESAMEDISMSRSQMAE
jgi:hypothetical protein